MRNYKRKTDKASINEKNMMAAIRDIQKGKMTIKEASTHYGISDSTLLFRLKRVKSETGPHVHQEVTFEMGLKNRDKSSKYASHQVFKTVDENLLVEYLVTYSKLIYGLTMEATRKLAYNFAVSLHQKFPESWTKNQKAGKDWVRGFLNRHSEISLMKPENTHVKRTTVNRKKLTVYFENLEEIMREHSFAPSRIWNLGETGLSIAVKAPGVSVEQDIFNEEGEKVSIVGIVNAAGESIPPVYIFPRKRHQGYMKDSPEGSMALFNVKGCLDSEGFVKILEHINFHAAPSQEDPILIVSDNHSSHYTLDVMRICRQTGIHMVSLPAQISYKIQPLDLTDFGPFELYSKKIFNAWLTENPEQLITLHNFTLISASAIEKSFSSKNIKSGFAKSGVYPLDRSKMFENIEDPISEDSSTVSTDPQVMDETSVDFSDDDHMPDISNSPSPLSLDLFETPLVSPAPASPLVPPIQLKFGGLEILRPLPTPLVSQKKSTVSRRVSSTIVSGSSDAEVQGTIAMCGICNMKFCDLDRLTKHVRDHNCDNSERFFACRKCGRNFMDEAALNRHKKSTRSICSRGPEPVFPCLYCKGNYRNMITLKRHIATYHLGLPTEIKGFPVSCTICGQKFYNMEGLKSHKQAHTARQLFPCGICGKNFAEERYMKIHLRLHEKTYIDDRISGASEESGRTQKKVFQCQPNKQICPACGKDFVLVPSFINHINNHTNPSLWECPTCFHKFKVTKDLMTHMTTTCDGVFWCQFCDFFCEAPIDYVRHVRNHEEFKLIFCPFCSEGFRKMDEFTDHIDKIHREKED